MMCNPSNIQSEHNCSSVDKLWLGIQSSFMETEQNLPKQMRHFIWSGVVTREVEENVETRGHLQISDDDHTPYKKWIEEVEKWETPVLAVRKKS